MPRPTPDTHRPTLLSQIERAYGGYHSHAREKASGLTTLDYDSWLLARTPSFKDWFGDWERLRAERRLDEMKPVNVRVPEEWVPLTEKQITIRLRLIFDEMIEARSTITQSEFGPIKIGRIGAKKSGANSKDIAKVIVAANIASLIPSAIYSRTEIPVDEDSRDVIGYSKLLLRIQLRGLHLVALFTVRRQKDGDWYYNTTVYDDENNKARDSGGRPERPICLSSDAPIASLACFKRKPLQRVNPQSVSAAINPHTGEPLAAAIDAFLHRLAAATLGYHD